MEEIISKENVPNYIKDHIRFSMTSSCYQLFARYHHSTFYHVAPSIIEHGFLSIADQQESGLSTYSEATLNRMQDDYHVNGDCGISFAVMHLPDLYPGEFEFDPKSPTCVDFRVDIPWRLVRNSKNYGNEFISQVPVDSKYIRSVDIRLLDYLNNCLYDGNVDEIINRYNDIISIAQAIQDFHNDIIIRERSNHEKHILDSKVIASYPKVNIKK